MIRTPEDEEIAAAQVRWEEEKAAMAEFIARREAQARLEREEAQKAVARALAGYRWWGWTNIVNTIRIWIQCFRQR